jgi:hypothetical protein
MRQPLISLTRWVVAGVLAGNRGWKRRKPLSRPPSKMPYAGSYVDNGAGFGERRHVA